jgi:membrane-associated phospholipid phosphatase
MKRQKGLKRNPRTILAVLLAVALCLFVIARLDLPLACWVHAHAPRGSAAYRLAVIISGFGRGHFYIIPSLVCAAVWWRRRDLARVRASLLVTATWAASGVAGLAFKHLLGRSRPSEYFPHGEYGFFWFEPGRPHASLPSGHTTDVFAAAALLWGMFPAWRPAWAAWALLMAASRVVSRNHYLADTIAGACLGVAVAGCVRAAFVRRGWYAAAGVAEKSCASGADGGC